MPIIYLIVVPVDTRGPVCDLPRSLVLMRKGDEGWSLVDLRGSDPG